jgi:hypothetical protein
LGQRGVFGLIFNYDLCFTITLFKITNSLCSLLESREFRLTRHTDWATKTGPLESKGIQTLFGKRVGAFGFCSWQIGHGEAIGEGYLVQSSQGFGFNPVEHV